MRISAIMKIDIRLIGEDAADRFADNSLVIYKQHHYMVIGQTRRPALIWRQGWMGGCLRHETEYSATSRRLCSSEIVLPASFELRGSSSCDGTRQKVATPVAGHRNLDLAEKPCLRSVIVLPRINNPSAREKQDCSGYSVAAITKTE